MRYAVLFLAVLPALCDGPAERQIRVQPTDTIIPQIVDGGAWKTIITVVNLSDQIARYTLSFYDATGSPTSFQIIGRHGSALPYELGPVRIIDSAIPVHGRHVWETAAGPTAENKEGWAELTGIVPTGSVGGMATLIAESVPDYPLSEAVVPINAANDTRMLLPFDNTNLYVSSYAIVNPTHADATVTLTAYALEGGSPWGTWQFTMPARSHTAFATVPNANLAFMAGRIGTIELRTSGAGLAALGLRFNPRGAFTSFHALSLPTWIAP